MAIKQPPRMDKQSALRRQARRELPALLVEKRRKDQAAAELSKAPRLPRAVQRALREAKKEELRRHMDAQRAAIKEQLGAPVFEGVPAPPSDNSRN